MKDIFILLAAFQLKHFLCDFPFQTQYMLGKFKKVGWIDPLLRHTLTHFLGTAIICLWYLQTHPNKIDPLIPATLASLDLIIHFIVDRIKAHPDLGGRWKPDSKYFWWCIGLDQMAHHFTHYAIIAYLVTR